MVLASPVGLDDNGPTVSATERRDSKEAIMLTDPSTAARPRGPLDQTYPMGHWPSRRTLPADLAAALWAARVNSGLSNRDAARLIGIDPSYLSKLVRGTRCPSRVVAERFIVFLPLTEDQQAALRVVAVPDHGKSFGHR